jgi:phosphate transport system protein
MTEHTYKPFDADLEKLRALVLELGGMVESQVLKAVTALAEHDGTLANEVIATERQVDALEGSVDDLATQIIALRCPTANDLRMILTVARSASDLERIGDKAVKIALYVHKMIDSDRLQSPRYNEIRFMSDLSLKMLREALNAFARLDAHAATDICRQDLQVNEEFRHITRNLMTYMMEDPRTISTCIDLMFLVKAIERIGDHAVNIANYVVYMVEGKNVRHATPDEIEAQLR